MRDLARSAVVRAVFGQTDAVAANSSSCAAIIFTADTRPRHTLTRTDAAYDSVSNELSLILFYTG